VTPEGKVKARISAILKRLSVQYVMPIAGPISTPGVSDYICNVGGLFVAIEAKAGKGKLTPLQKVFLERAKEGGGFGLVITEANVEFLETWLSELLKHADTRLGRRPHADRLPLQASARSDTLGA
jgi:hypothetical protein